MPTHAPPPHLLSLPSRSAARATFLTSFPPSLASSLSAETLSPPAAVSYYPTLHMCRHTSLPHHPCPPSPSSRTHPRHKYTHMHRVTITAHDLFLPPTPFPIQTGYSYPYRPLPVRRTPPFYDPTQPPTSGQPPLRLYHRSCQSPSSLQQPDVRATGMYIVDTQNECLSPETQSLASFTS